MDARADAILERALAVAERAPSLADLDRHGVQLLAAHGLRARGRAVPAPLAAQERVAAAAALAAPPVLARVREAADGPLLLVKGPEVARRYPDRLLRCFGDVDLIVPDAEATQRELIAAGFEEVGDPALYEGIHHLRPLRAGRLPLEVEVHRAPKWVARLEPPPFDRLLEGAAPARCGVDGVLAPSPAAHALLLAAHGWAHRPLGRLGDLLDVALVAREADGAEIERLARAWGLRRLWRTTARAIEAVLGDGAPTAALAIWARHLRGARERSVLESHLERWLSPLWGLPAAAAPGALAGAIRADLVPEGAEGWPRKLARTRAALADAFARKSDHDRALRGEQSAPPAPTEGCP